MELKSYLSQIILMNQIEFLLLYRFISKSINKLLLLLKDINP